MDTFALIGEGVLALFTPIHLGVLFLGLVMGLLAGVLPGLTLVMGVVLALPFTYGLGILPAVILLTAMYVAGTYGGAFTSILFKIPGEPLDVPLLWDGHTMARKGQPSLALGWTLVSALGGGLVAALAMVLIAHPIANVALMLSSHEYFAIILFGLASVICLGAGSLPASLVSLTIGLFLAVVGLDTTYGVDRFTFGVPIFSDGIEYLAVMVGVYGLAEILTRIHQGATAVKIDTSGRASTEIPTLKEIVAMKGVFARSSVLGFVTGLVPGAGATIASFLSYGMESQFGKRRALLGTGIPEGIVAPQTAATASVGGAMVPLLTMGIPGSGATAIIMGAFLLHGVQPGPNVFFNSGPLIYTIFASVFAAVIGMCVIGYVAARGLVKVLDFPEAVVSAFVVMFCFLGAFAARNNVADLWVIVAFGVLGFFMEKYKFPIAPLVLGVILGPIAESNFMTAMISSGGDWTTFFSRPISGSIIGLTLLAVLLPLLSGWLTRRRAANAPKVVTHA
ncbi:tripartite tricarboxylate transporter permease [Hansschlegelia sp. KR7-227]|uniref:tripartite tricarboxylate transporter permease n=1 Tax=Hansschlegelia sp. KR7-227 TaxID=3400914 RepID=UPI003BFE7ED8